MSASNFNLRGVPSEVMDLLKEEAKRLRTSINALIINMLERSLGVSTEISRPVYHDLDHLAGSWSPADVKDFEKNTQPFEQIDKEIWGL